MKTLRLLIPLTLLILSLVPATAQQQTERPPAADDPLLRYTESIEVRVVEVEVFVTDKKGNPVTDLTRDDFELLENGRPVPISNFYAVDGGHMVARQIGEMEPEVVEPGQREIAPVPEKQQLYMIVFVDHINISPFSRNKVFASLRDFLRLKMNPDDRVMLVTYDRSLHIVEPFTTDHLRIVSAIRGEQKHDGERVIYNSDRWDLLEYIDTSSEYRAARVKVENYAESIRNDLRYTLDAIKQVISALAGVEGRKALLYVSEGLPMKAAYEMFFAMDEKYGGSSGIVNALEYDSTRWFEDLTMLANANRVTLYTIDAAGLRTRESVSARYRTHGTVGPIDDVTVDNLQESIRYMADRTGGKAVVNTNNMDKAVETIAADFKNFYSLGYKPSHREDGSFYRIDVKVKRKGLEVRHHRGFRDQTPAGQLRDGTLSSLVLGYQNNRQGLRVSASRPEPTDSGLYLVSVEVKVPIRKLLLVPAGEYHEGRVTIFAATQDERGGMSEVQENPFAVQIPEADIDKAMAQNYVFELRLMMGPGIQRLALGFRDDLENEVSYVLKTIPVGQ